MSSFAADDAVEEGEAVQCCLNSVGFDDSHQSVLNAVFEATLSNISVRTDLPDNAMRLSSDFVTHAKETLVRLPPFLIVGD